MVKCGIKPDAGESKQTILHFPFILVFKQFSKTKAHPDHLDRKRAHVKRGGSPCAVKTVPHVVTRRCGRKNVDSAAAVESAHQSARHIRIIFLTLLDHRLRVPGFNLLPAVGNGAPKLHRFHAVRRWRELTVIAGLAFGGETQPRAPIVTHEQPEEEQQ